MDKGSTGYNSLQERVNLMTILGKSLHLQNPDNSISTRNSNSTCQTIPTESKTETETDTRIKATLSNISLCLVSTGLFVEKAKMFHENIFPSPFIVSLDFIIGFDTLTRLLDPKYYPSLASSSSSSSSLDIAYHDGMLQILDPLFLNNGRLLVFPRPTASSSQTNHSPLEDLMKYIENNSVANVLHKRGSIVILRTSNDRHAALSSSLARQLIRSYWESESDDGKLRVVDELYRVLLSGIVDFIIENNYFR
jgi:hypothetical protein